MSLGNLAIANPTVVLPNSLATAFVMTSTFPLLSQVYHDGTVERGLITDAESLFADPVNPPRPVRTWKLSRRLTVATLATLRTFWETTVQGGLYPFYFYDPFDTGGGPAGSNYDPTGDNEQGRATVYFRGSWKESYTPGLNDVPDLMLIEVA